MIPRAQTGFVAPRAEAVQPMASRAAAAGMAQLQDSVSGLQRIAMEKVRAREQADDAAAIIDTENKYRKGLLELETELRNEVPENGDGYVRSVQERRSALREQVIKEVPSYVTEMGKQGVSNVLSRIDGDSDIRATLWEDETVKGWVRRTYETSLNEDVAALMANPDSLSAIETGTGVRLEALAGRFTPDELAAMRSGTRRQLAAAAVTGLADNGRYDDARKALGAFSGDLDVAQQTSLQSHIEGAESGAEAARMEALSLAIYQDEMGRDEIKALRDSGSIPDDGTYQSLLRQVDQREQQVMAEARAAQAEAQDRYYSMLKVGIDDGRMGRADVERAYAQGRITPSQYSSSAIAANNYKVSTDLSDSFVSLLAAGAPIDPSNADIKSGADATYRKHANLDAFRTEPEAAVDLLKQFARSGIVPETGASVLRGMASSGTDEQKQFAASAIYDLWTENSVAVDVAFTSKEVADAISYRDKVDAGVSPGVAWQALTMEREMRDTRGAGSRVADVRAAEAREIVAKFTPERALRMAGTGGIFGESGILSGGGGLVGGADAEAAVLSDYRQAFEAYYLVTGDEKLAEKQTKALLARTIGASKANNNMFMQHPPERYYAADGNDKWIKDAVAAIAQEATGEQRRARDVRIVSDTITARQVADGVAPSYQMMVRNGRDWEFVPGRVDFVTEAAEAQRTAITEAERKSKQDKAAAAIKASEKREQKASFYEEETPMHIPLSGGAPKPFTEEEKRIRAERAAELRGRASADRDRFSAEGLE